MLRIPLQAVPNQTLAVNLARQAVQIALRFNGNAIYFDLLKDGAYIVRSRICRDRQRLLLDSKYKGFIGDFVFVDTQGIDDPHFIGLNTRYQLIYLAVGE